MAKIRKTKKRAVRRVARRPARKVAAKAKSLSKKVGKWRVTCSGRTVTAAGAKHAYKTHAAACAAYKRITSVKAISGFVTKYGKKATKKAVVGRIKRRNPDDKPACAAAPATNPRRRKARKSRRSASIAAARRILRRRGYIA